jgi:hypothetical protein
MIFSSSLLEKKLANDDFIDLVDLLSGVLDFEDGPVF